MSKRKQLRTIEDFFGGKSKKCDTNVTNGQNENPTDPPSNSTTATECECNGQNENSTDPPSNSTNPATESDRNKVSASSGTRSFQSSWSKSFAWLRFDPEKNQMFCDLCIKHKKVNTLTEGTSNFRTSTLTRHADCKDHEASVLGDNLQSSFAKTVQKAHNDREQAVLVALKTVYWMAKENLPLHKYPSLLDFLKILDCPNVSQLAYSGNASYNSETAAGDMLESLASAIRSDIDELLHKSPFISVFADESTDIGCEKKLAIYVRVLDPDTYKPSTHFLVNIKVPDGTGRVVSEAIVDSLEQRNVHMSNVMGFGSDGAKAMTGTGEGVTGHLLRLNPSLLNCHCIAHRLALVSSQAANSVPYLKEYQETLTGLFYFFKASANRCEKLSAIQKLLDEPKLKMAEVHEVRWMSIYKAVETVYRCLDSLITLFTTEKDAKAKGYGKKIANSDFISTTYMLMDVLPVITELCLVFQKTDLDVSMVEISVDHCKKTLEGLKSDGVLPTGKPTYLNQLQDHMKSDHGKLMFKGNHAVNKGQRQVSKLKDTFIDELIANLDQRFPAKDSNLMYCFGVLGMRPLSFLSKQQLSTWGDEKINPLINHFGEEQTHKHAGTTYT